jgi:hypothetical protein
MREWPLVGREAEVASLEGLVAVDESVVLAGPPGAGKTRLAAVAGALATKAGHHVVSLVGSPPAASIPLGALAPVLHDAGVSAGGFSAARAAFADLRGDRTVTVVVDDAQWLDDASAVLLHQLVATGDVVLVATLRTGTHVPEPIVALWKDGLATRLEVQALGRDSVASLLEAVLDGPVESLAVARFAGRSLGNVLYLRELLDGAMQAGSLERREGIWRLVRALPVTERLAELVAGRIRRLAVAEQEALTAVGFAEPVDLDLLEGVVGAALVAALDRQDFLRVVDDRGVLRVSPAHPLYGDVLRAGISDIERRGLSRKFADALAARGELSDADQLRLALWRLDAGQTAEPSLLLAAARTARASHDDVTSERLARAAWRADPSFATGHVLVDVLYALGHHDESDDLHRIVGGLASTDEERAVIALSGALTSFWGLADAEAADAALADAEAEIGDEGWRHELRATRATLRSQAGDHTAALDLLTALPRPIANPRAAAQAALAEAFSLAAIGRGNEAVAVIDAATDARGRLGPQLTLYQAGLLLAARAMALVDLGHLGEAHELAVFGLHVSLDEGDTSALG